MGSWFHSCKLVIASLAADAWGHDRGDSQNTRWEDTLTRVAGQSSSDFYGVKADDVSEIISEGVADTGGV